MKIINKTSFITILCLIFYMFAVEQVISQKNIYPLFLVCALVVIPIVFKYTLPTVLLIILIPPATQWAVELNYLPDVIMWFPELLSGMLFCAILIKFNIEGKSLQFYGLSAFLPFLIITVISLLYNNIYFGTGLLFLRVLFRYYLLFIFIVNMEFSEVKQQKIIKFISAVFLVQLPIAIIKVFTWGQGETPISLNSHSTTTFIALIAFGFLLALYIAYRPNKLYIILILGFIGFSLVGGKRATIFLSIFILLHTIWHLRHSIRNLLKIFIVGSIIGIFFLYFALRLIPTLNPQRQIWGNFDPAFAISYAQYYDTAHSKRNAQPIGRISTSIHVYDLLSHDGILTQLFGFGPGSIMKSRFQNADSRAAISQKFGIGYGINGINWMALQVGYLGFISFIYFYWLILNEAIRCFHSEEQAFWRAFALGMANFSFVMLFIAQYYSPAYKDDSLSILFFCLAAITVLRSKKAELLSKTGAVC
jgi:hypothetical protein